MRSSRHPLGDPWDLVQVSRVKEEVHGCQPDTDLDRGDEEPYGRNYRDSLPRSGSR